MDRGKFDQRPRIRLPDFGENYGNSCPSPKSCPRCTIYPNPSRENGWLTITQTYCKLAYEYYRASIILETHQYHYSTVQSFHYYSYGSNRSLTYHPPSLHFTQARTRWDVNIQIEPGFPGGWACSLAPTTAYKKSNSCDKEQIEIE